MVRSVTISNLTNITTAALVVAVLNLFPCAGAMAQQMPGSGKVAEMKYSSYKAPEPETPSGPEFENQDQKGNTSDAGCPEGQSEVRGECIATDVSSPNQEQSQQSVTGCTVNLGLFAGLITVGSSIFKGLRDLIYVVAGFGIIGVAIGGFFGNLNWKWLGAIIIALIVIASTGEIIDMITGCENFTQGLITDTLK